MTCVNPKCRNPLGRETNGYLNGHHIRIPICFVCRMDAKPKPKRKPRDTKTALCPNCNDPMTPDAMLCRECMNARRSRDAADRRKARRTCPTCGKEKGEWTMQCNTCHLADRRRLKGTP